ncbi:radical SAM protein [Streptomyces sp. G45]|uniref:radical SAM protein n=1 Tax=Streptomyces sp. G45 TaxID=3406627 RepID=UPI003C2306CA
MTTTSTAPATPAAPTFLELEITRRCQLTCASHCYAEAGPARGHGSMTGDDWRNVISDAARVGVEMVQLIGGEPTTHPQFTALLTHALNCGLAVRVFSNLYRVRLEWWALFAHPRVTLATSYYSDDPDEHDAITGRGGSHDRTRANILEAVRRDIPIKVGIIHMREGQRSDQARAEMESLGVTHVRVDRVREVGNAAVKADALPSVTQLCGSCGQGRAAVGPDGQVWPCVLSRFLHPAGNVRTSRLADVFASDTWAALVSAIPRPRRGACVPDSCTPKEDSCQPSPGTDTDRTVTACNPDLDGDDCSPAETPACLPAH